MRALNVLSTSRGGGTGLACDLTRLRGAGPARTYRIFCGTDVILGSIGAAYLGSSGTSDTARWLSIFVTARGLLMVSQRSLFSKCRCAAASTFGN